MKDMKRILELLFENNSEEIKAIEEEDYDPWNFEEEDLEEDDFYYEDDETSMENFYEGEDDSEEED